MILRSDCCLSWAVFVVALFKPCQSFTILPTMPSGRISPRSPSTASLYQLTQHFHPRRQSVVSLRLNIDSEDPFQVLDIDDPTADKKVIKRAYKRMALKYHPDVATTKDSTPEEKKKASDRFAKINWAYGVLSGKRQNDSTYTKNPTSSSTSAGGGWTPPHRRSGAYSSSTGSSRGASDDADWTDFMPKGYDEQYEAGGDSFGKIFSELFEGAATGAAGMGGSGLFRDFIEFLEGNVDGFGGAEDDAELKVLLQTGSLDEIGNEMDDTELVVKQLNSKLSAINDEIMTVAAEVKLTTRYVEKIEMEESLAELNARKEVVNGYVKKAQKRLLVLQTQYKELITGGQNDSYAGGKSNRSSRDDFRNEASSTASSSSSSSYSQSPSSRASSGPSTSSTSPKTERKPQDEEDAWMNESFGSAYGRGRGGSRRRSRQGRSSTSSSTSETEEKATSSRRENTSRPPNEDTNNTQKTSSNSSTSENKNRARRTSQASAPSGSSSGIQSNSSDSFVPPHRRTSGSYASKQEEDKKRMREIKVDDEFDKLKKELGL